MLASGPARCRRRRLRCGRLRVERTEPPRLCGASFRPVRVVTSRGPAAAALLVVLFVVGLTMVAPEAQEVVRIVGSVQWVSGSKMQVLTETGASIAVDLTDADQSSYQALRGGETVVVDGVLSSDRRRIIANEIWRNSGRGYWTQSP